MPGDEYWPTERVVAEMQADHPDVDAERIESILYELEDDGLVRYEPGKGWQLRSLSRAFAFMAKHDKQLAAKTAAEMVRERSRAFLGRQTNADRPDGDA